MKSKFEAWRSGSHLIAFTLAVVSAFTLVVMSLPVAPQAQQQPTAAAVDQPLIASQDGPLIAIQDGMLTFRGQNQTLRRVLEQIEWKARVRIVLAPSVGNEQVSVDFQRFPLDEALRKILKNYDAFFLYGVGKENKEAAGLSAVWVYPAGGARGLRPLSPDAWASTQEVEQMLRNSDPELRVRAVAEMIKRKGRQSGDVVRDALKDDSGMVRLAALRTALRSGLEVSQQTLVDLAVNDQSAIVRFLALENLPADPSLQWVAERALQDPDPNVSQKAREFLQQFTAASAPPYKSPTQRGVNKSL